MAGQFVDPALGRVQGGEEIRLSPFARRVAGNELSHRLVPHDPHTTLPDRDRGRKKKNNKKEKMTSQQRPTSVAGTREKTFFEQQREELIGEIAMVRSVSSSPSHPSLPPSERAGGGGGGRGNKSTSRRNLDT